MVGCSIEVSSKEDSTSIKNHKLVRYSCDNGVNTPYTTRGKLDRNLNVISWYQKSDGTISSGFYVTPEGVTCMYERKTFKEKIYD